MDFTFISDGPFRESLVADHAELLSGLNAKAWKSVHVLAGSIVEALLTEYLVVSGLTPNGRDPLTLQLADVVLACKSAGVINSSTASLCDVVRDYRNLIHPGRLVRLERAVSKESAYIAANLVTLIAREVAEKRKKTYGPSADQIVKKLQGDQQALAVFPHILAETNEYERTRLVEALIPEACSAAAQALWPTDVLLTQRLRDGYRKTLDTLPNATKARIATTFSRIIREESADQIAFYGDLFFSASDIVHLSPQDARITITHLLNRIEQPIQVDNGVEQLLTGITQVLSEEQIKVFANCIIRLALKQTQENFNNLFSLALTEYAFAEDEKKQIFTKRIEYWMRFAQERSLPAASKERLSRLESAWFDIPF